eukprot:4033494-Amphidinium_carterae.1
MSQADPQEKSTSCTLDSSVGPILASCLWFLHDYCCIPKSNRCEVASSEVGTLNGFDCTAILIIKLSPSEFIPYSVNFNHMIPLLGPQKTPPKQ